MHTTVVGRYVESDKGDQGKTIADFTQAIELVPAHSHVKTVWDKQSLYGRLDLLIVIGMQSYLKRILRK